MSRPLNHHLKHPFNLRHSYMHHITLRTITIFRGEISDLSKVPGQSPAARTSEQGAHGPAALSLGTLGEAAWMMWGVTQF